MRKKLLATILASAMVFSLAACGSSNSDSGEEQSADGEVTLRMLSANEAIDETMMQEFMDANPGINIDYEYVSAADAHTKMASLLTADDLPDVFVTQSDTYVNLVDEGALLDLTEAMNEPCWEGDVSWKDSYEEELLLNCEDILKKNLGELDTYSYGAPFSMTTVAVLYDASVYEELGLEVPQDWASFISNLDALKEAGYSSISVQNSTCIDWMPRLFWDQYCRTEMEDEGKNFEDGSMTFSSDSVREGLIQYKAMYDAGYFPESFLTETVDTVLQKFIQGELPQLMITTDKIQYLVDNAPEGMKLSSYALPGINGLPPRSLGGSSVILAASAKTEHPDEAVTLLKYLTSRTNFETNKKLALVTAGLKGVSHAPEYADLLKGYDDAAANGFIPEIMVPVNLNSEMNTTFRSDLLPGYLEGNYSLDDVCDTMQEMYDEYQAQK